MALLRSKTSAVALRAGSSLCGGRRRGNLAHLRRCVATTKGRVMSITDRGGGRLLGGRCVGAVRRRMAASPQATARPIYSWCGRVRLYASCRAGCGVRAFLSRPKASGRLAGAVGRSEGARPLLCGLYGVAMLLLAVP